MKTNRKACSLAAALIIFGSLVGGANAALVISVSDAGSGQTQFEFLGSDIVTSGGFLGHGLAFDPANWDSYPIGSPVAYTILSGGFSITTTFNGTSTGLGIGLTNDGFALSTGGNSIFLQPGDTVSWTGTVIVNDDFSDWSSALYDNPTTGVFGNGEVTLSSNIFISSIPEPSLTLLFGLSSFIIAFRRSRY